MKVLITGASGFIGGFLVEEALRRGYDVWAGIRAGSSRERLQDARIRFIDLKYNDPNMLKKQLMQFAAESGRWDFVIHNAGVTKTTRPGDFSRINAGYTAALVEALADNCKPEKFLLMSSLGAYGPGDEHSLAPLTSESPQRPDSLYGKSKLEAEKILAQQSAFPYVIIHPTGVYGPWDQDYFAEINSINLGFDFAAGMSDQHISFIYVKDLARAVFMALESDAASGKRYFVSDGQQYTDAQFASIIKDILGKKRLLRIRVPLPLLHLACVGSELVGKLQGKAMTLNSDKFHILKARNWLCDASPLFRDLNFRPEYSLRQGLEEAIQWYRAKGWL
ncbi:MAG: NAD(P)-dependent oxidoreductase [Tannerellaceae bacterium]|jgi:nucleoside-diphosphate-sugar epimerase|nr:NAD(P)-dependent oxidoreductase [Tannerellaceae bacterium]